MNSSLIEPTPIEVLSMKFWAFQTPSEKPDFFVSLGIAEVSYESYNFYYYSSLPFKSVFRTVWIIYASAANIREIMKFYDLGDQSFETDYRHFRNNWVLQVTSDNGTDCVIIWLSEPAIFKGNGWVNIWKHFNLWICCSTWTFPQQFADLLLFFRQRVGLVPVKTTATVAWLRSSKRSDSKTTIRQTLISSLPQSLLQQSTL